MEKPSKRNKKREYLFMNIVSSSDKYIIIDDFLNASEYNDMWMYCQNDDFRYINTRHWKKAWKITDGSPLHGSLLFSNNIAAEVIGDKYSIKKELRRVFPFCNTADIFFERMYSISHKIIGLVGSGSSGLRGFAFVPYIYPAGTGLSWHQENGIYAGSFIYYTNPVWKADWGGELMIADHPTGVDLCRYYEFSDGRKISLMNHLDSSEEDNVLMKMASGIYIMPKPNRLVVLKAGVAHKVNKVNSIAEPRVSCTGFFVK